MDELIPPRIESVWSQYDPKKDGESGGIYMFLLTPFSNAPYYVGETKTFASRFAEHDKLFATGLRTFFRKPFMDGAGDKSHIGFGRRWEDIRRLGRKERAKFLFVPTNSNNLTMAHEGSFYKENAVTRIVWKIASTKKGREALEVRLQDEVKS